MRNRIRYCVFLFVLAMTPSAALSQGTCDRIANAQKSLYGFQPHTLTKEEQAKKSRELDAFWDLVKGRGEEGVMCLRPIVEKQTDPFGAFDEASLLFSLDHAPESLRVAVQGAARANLADVVPADYVHLALQLAHAGADIEPMAHNYLNAPTDVTSYLPIHGNFKLTRLLGASLLYGIMPTDEIDDALSKEVKSSFAEGRNTALILWTKNLTERSFKSLSQLGAMDGFSDEAKDSVRFILTAFEVPVTPPKYTREQMLAKIAAFPNPGMDPEADFNEENQALDNSAYATLTVEDVATLREARRKFITDVSNEAVEGYDEISRVLFFLINRLHLYSEYRTVKSSKAAASTELGLRN